MTIPPASFAPASFAVAEPRSPEAHILIEHLNKYLAPEDIQFMNARGPNGAPDWGHDYSQCKPTEIRNSPSSSSVATFLRCLYGASSIESSYATAAYFGTEFLKHNELAIQSMNSMLSRNGLDETTKAVLEQSLANLQNIWADYLQRCQDQMTRLLDDFSSLLEHRGVAGEASAIEVFDDINAVKRNIASFKAPHLSEEAARFFTIYIEKTKQQYEFYIAHARNPFHLDYAFTANIHAGQSADQAWQNAMEKIERPRVLAYAQRLKEILSPYAQISSPSQDEMGEKAQNTDVMPSHPQGSWELA